MRASILAAALSCAIGCASSPPATERATLDGLAYEVPAGWQSQDLSDRRARIVVWSPASNPRKETVAVMRTAPLPALAKAGDPRIAQRLEQAQRGLPSARFSAPVRFTTKHGFAGVRVHGELVPALPGERPYRRIHAVLVDAATSSLVHVLYTALVPNDEAFETVIDHLRRGA
jgi:hypothetical protein